MSEFSLTSILTLLGGALIALGIEKLVSQRLRTILVEIAEKKNITKRRSQYFTQERVKYCSPQPLASPKILSQLVKVLLMGTMI